MLRVVRRTALRVVQKSIQLEWPVRLAGPWIGKFNPFLREYRSNPYPQYHALRRSAPIYFSPAFRGLILSRYADIVPILQDARFGVDRTQARVFQQLDLFGALSPDFAATVATTLLMQDPPSHTRLRRLVNKAFTPRVVEQLRGRIQGIVDELIDRIKARGEMALVDDFACPLPVRVIAEMLGVAADDRVEFKKWSDALTVLLDPIQASGGMAPAERAYAELSAYMRNVFAARRQQPRDDLISALVAVEEAGEHLNETELMSLVTLILGAGHETTTNLIGNAVMALLENPTERRRLQDDPALIRTAVEEFLRFDSPIQLTDRVANEDLEVGDHRVRKGDLIGLILGAANRDPEKFPQPDRLDLGRQDNDHIAFSHGVHFCLGAQLARVEAQVAIPGLLAAFPDLRGPLAPVEWKRSIVLRGPEEVRLAI
jgi:cytochrome P450